MYKIRSIPKGHKGWIVFFRFHLPELHKNCRNASALLLLLRFDRTANINDRRCKRWVRWIGPRPGPKIYGKKLRICHNFPVVFGAQIEFLPFAEIWIAQEERTEGGKQRIVFLFFWQSLFRFFFLCVRFSLLALCYNFFSCLLGKVWEVIDYFQRNCLFDDDWSGDDRWIKSDNVWHTGSVSCGE